MAGDQSGEIALSSRVIPAPSTISPEAQATLTVQSPLFDEPEPSPGDKEEWRRYIRDREARVADRFTSAPDRYPCATSIYTAGEAEVYEIVPQSCGHGGDGPAVLFFHGGAYTSGGGIYSAYLAMPFAHNLGMRTHAVDYRMPPDHPFPAALDDAVAAYDALLQRLPPERIMVAGRSAGGGLAAALLLRAQDTRRPMPAACVLQTPEVDLTQSGDSMRTNDGLDNGLRRLDNSVVLYADGHDLTEPYLSPLFGSYQPGFPPTLLTSGTRDLFLSSTVLMHRALRRAGADAELHVWEAMGHGGFLEMAPEDAEVWEELRRFVGRHAGRV